MSVTLYDVSTEIDYVSFAFIYDNNKNTMTAYNAMLNIASIGYTANESSDEAESVTDGEDNVVNYTYDSDGNLVSVSSYDSSNTYSYNGVKNIFAITHNGFSYTFNYDVFQNLVSTYIGNVAISTNTYSANNGNLTKTTYANGDYIQYTYDNYDNITKITGETGTIAEFIYNKKGLVSKAIDYSSGRTTYYYYVNKIKNSNTIKNFLEKFNTIGRYENLIHEQRHSRYFYGEYDNNKNSIFNLSFYSDSKDLKLSIGHATVNASLIHISHIPLGATVTNWRLLVTVSDRYNFELFDPEEKGYITSLINNKLGYEKQENEELVEYDWKISFYIEYQYTCFHGSSMMYVGDTI